MSKTARAAFFIVSTSVCKREFFWGIVRWMVAEIAYFMTLDLCYECMLRRTRFKVDVTYTRSYFLFAGYCHKLNMSGVCLTNGQ